MHRLTRHFRVALHIVNAWLYVTLYYGGLPFDTAVYGQFRLVPTSHLWGRGKFYGLGPSNRGAVRLGRIQRYLGLWGRGCGRHQQN